VNEAFTSLTGYSAEVVFGKSPGMLQGAETDPSVIERLREYIDAGRVFEGATYNCRKDGSNFMMHWRVAPVREDDNKPEYFVAVQRAQSESRE
jgi:PAS domain S-box-containing protein